MRHHVEGADQHHHREQLVRAGDGRDHQERREQLTALMGVEADGIYGDRGLTGTNRERPRATRGTRRRARASRPVGGLIVEDDLGCLSDLRSVWTGGEAANSEVFRRLTNDCRTRK